ncbi:MAG: DUF4349 domain-containing protein [Clostridia bacterium]
MKKLIYLSLLLVLLIAGCSSSYQDSVNQEPSYDSANDEMGSSSDSLQKIIKSGNMSMDVDSLDSAIKEIDILIQEYNGQIIKVEKYSSGENNYAFYKIKVPSEDYDAMHDSLIKLGKVTNDTTSTRDVTEEFIDLNARLDMLKDSKEAYTRLLDRAETVEEILQVERELERIVYEIESTQGRIDYINNQVEMSSINISIKEKAATEFEGINFFERIQFAIKDGFNSMLNFLVNVVIALIWLIPFLPFIFLLYIVIKKIRQFLKKRKERKVKNKEQ